MQYIQVRSPDGMLRAMVDDEDLVTVFPVRWYMAGGKGSKGKYAAAASGRSSVYMHRMIAVRMGLIPEVVGSDGGKWKFSIDHINGDCLDNRRDNLRLISRSRQMRNGNDALRSTNTSGYRGVCWDESRGKWQARATLHYKAVMLGRFNTKEEAHAARLRWDAAQREGYR